MEYPNTGIPAEPDIVVDLMNLDIGILYRKIAKADAQRRSVWLVASHGYMRIQMTGTYPPLLTPWSGRLVV